MSEDKKPSPKKKISTTHYDEFTEFLKRENVSIPDDLQSKMISEGLVASRSWQGEKRGWVIDGVKITPSLSYQGLGENEPTEEMKTFREKYYQLLEDNVGIIDNDLVKSES